MSTFSRVAAFVLIVGGALFFGYRFIEGPGAPEPGPASGTQATEATVTTSSAADMTTNAAALDIIKKSEGLKLEAYQGPGGQWFIGYGHTAGVTPGMTITESEADQYLREDLRTYENAVASAVNVPVNRNEFSAMVSLTYNIGTGNFGSSSVVTKLNAGDRRGAADAFLLWNKGRQNGQSVVLEHLDNRRKEERALFLTP